MASYQTPLPPIANDGNYLSASWVNQLSEYVNSAGNYVYGANVAFWTNPTTLDITNDNITRGMYVLQHKYNTLKVKMTKGHSSMDAGIRLSKNDNFTSTIQPSPVVTEDSGYYTMTLDLTSISGSFPLAEDEIYFVYVNVDNNGGMSTIFEIGEYGTGLITAPSPALATLANSTVITASYLNSLRSAAFSLGAYTYPTNLPFAGFATADDWTTDTTPMRWRIKHLNRYLHYGFLTPSSNNTIKMYKDGVEIGSWANQLSQTISSYVDLNAVSLGTYYDIKFTISNAGSSIFRFYYLWELPYL